MRTTLSQQQLDIIRNLVGSELAAEDLPALERAYGDFRAAMDTLGEAFGSLADVNKEVAH